MMHDCPCDASGVRTLVLTQRDVDQGKVARFNYSLGSEFFCEIKFQALELSAVEAASGAGGAAAAGAAPAVEPAAVAAAAAAAGEAGQQGGTAQAAADFEVLKHTSLQETWEDD